MSARSPMVVRVARALCKRSSELCNVDNDDNWKTYGEEFLIDAEAAVEASGAPDLLEALYDMLEDGDATDRQKALAAIAKATGGQA